MWERVTHTHTHAICSAYLKYYNSTALITSRQQFTIMIEFDARYDICVCDIIF